MPDEIQILVPLVQFVAIALAAFCGVRLAARQSFRVRSLSPEERAHQDALSALREAETWEQMKARDIAVALRCRIPAERVHAVHLLEEDAMQRRTVQGVAPSSA